LTQRQRRAYSYAAIATAIYVSKMITIANRSRLLRLSIGETYRIRTVLNLDQDAGLLAPPQLLELEHLAQTKMVHRNPTSPMKSSPASRR